MELERRTAKADNQTDLEYFVYPKDRTEFERVIVYIHGLISSVCWFEIPEELPPDTGIVFLPRLPRLEVDRFETWTRNNELRLADFQAHHRSRYYHLVAQCFGVHAGAHWALTRPRTFDTMTIAAPPVELRNEFGLLKKLAILLGPAGGMQHCELTPRSYGRSPALGKFIRECPTTTFEFTNSLYLETHRLRKWLRKNLRYFPTPTHFVLTSEDAVAAPTLPTGLVYLPHRTNLLYSDHFCELLPSREEFWRTIFTFHRDYEGRYHLDGEIDSVLVTGATGFLGSHIVRRLHADGKRVVVFVRNTAKAHEMFADLEDRIEIRKGSLDDLESIARATEGIDAIVHTAGHVSDWDTYENFAHTNVEGTKNILFLAHESGVKQFVHISSLGIFGDVDQDNIDENNMHRYSSDHYSNTKIRAEAAVQQYCMINRIPFSIIRPGFIYGEGDNNFLPALIKTIKAGKAKYIGSKQNILNTVYVGNVSELVAAVLGNPEALGEAYNIADPQHTSIGRFVEDVCAGTGLTPPTKIVPKGVALTAATVMESIFRALRSKKAPPLTRKKVTFMARSRSVNASKAFALMGREPYSYEEGMKRTLASLES